MTKKHKPEHDLLEQPLNSFVRRTERSNEIKQLVISCGGKLSRKGRSRNWTLQISQQHKKALIDEIYRADEPSWLWIAKLLAEKKANYQAEDLLAIAKAHPAITIAELMSLTDCTITEARKTLDELEWS